MARIRTVKPEFWTDAKTGTLSELAKCLLLGMLNHADDYGVLPWELDEWRVKILPYHSDTTTGTVQKALVDELLPRGLVVLFDVSNGETRRCCFIRNFPRHQVINKPSKPLLPGWRAGDSPASYAERVGTECRQIGASGLLSEMDGSATGALPPGKEGKGEERKGIDHASRDSAPAVLARTPEAFPSAKDIDEAAAHWNTIAGELGLAQIEKLTDKRKRHLRARLSELGGLGPWFGTVNSIRQSPFLCGQKTDWRCDLDWLINPSNFQKLIEGKYHAKGLRNAAS